MNAPMGRGQPPDRVPTLTEVVEMPGGAGTPPAARAPDGALLSPEPVPAVIAPAPAPAGPALAAPDPASTDAIAQRLMADLQVHIERVLDARLRSALEPAMQALASRVIADTRQELASTLRDGLARALAQESARHRDEPGPR